MTELNITLEIIAAYKAWIKMINASESSGSVYYVSGLARKGDSKTRRAENAAKKKFVKAVVEAGNTGDWDTEKIMAKLSGQPDGIAYTF